MFIYCDDCGWQQDDFWDTNYNPIDSLNDWKNQLLKGDLDEKPNWSRKKTLREIILDDFSDSLNAVKNMKYRTLEELNEQNPEHKCPICGGELGID